MIHRTCPHGKKRPLCNTCLRKDVESLTARKQELLKELRATQEALQNIRQRVVQLEEERRLNPRKED